MPCLYSCLSPLMMGLAERSLQVTDGDRLDEVRSDISDRRSLFRLVGIPSLTGHGFPHQAAGNLFSSRVSTIGGWLSLDQDVRSACAYAVRFRMFDITPGQSSAARLGGPGKHGQCHGTRCTWGSSPAVITRSGQMKSPEWYPLSEAFSLRYS
jgi:hypothetical protein